MMRPVRVTMMLAVAAALCLCLGLFARHLVQPATVREARAAAGRLCPRCGERARIVPLVYGRPSAGQLERYARGEAAAGGDRPRRERWHCRGCGREW